MKKHKYSVLTGAYMPIYTFTVDDKLKLIKHYYASIYTTTITSNHRQWKSTEK